MRKDSSRPYRQLLASLDPSHLAEPSSIPLPDEISLQSLWFAGQFGRDFVTTCGRPVSIVQFGLWNRSAGPDFLNSAVEIDGQKSAGPLELDTHALDWEQHGHADNAAFDDVCLHVVFAEPNATFFTRTRTGREIPRVLIPQARVADALERPRFATALAHPGRCSTPLAEMPTGDVDALLRSAARHRFERKSRKLMHTVDAVGWHEMLWQGLARVLGYRPNALAFTLLAQRLPIAELRKNASHAEAILFGAAGWLAADLHERAPEHSQDYLRELWDRWWSVRQTYEVSPPRTIAWQMHGIRPTNHPHRRLGALAAVAHHWPELQKICRTTDDVRRPIKYLAALEHPFWSYQHTLLSKKSTRPLAIFGKTRAQDFAANILLPLHFGTDPLAWEQFLALPAPTLSEKVSKARVRLFGKRPDASNFTKRAWHHQALLQIYDDFCLQDSTDCAQCTFPEQLRNFRH